MARRYSLEEVGEESEKEEVSSGPDQDLRDIEREFEEELQTISEIGTPRITRIPRVSEGPVQPAGFQRNQEELERSEEVSVKYRDEFRRIEDYQEEIVVGKPVSDTPSKGLYLSLIKIVLAKTKMITNTVSTGCFDHGSARTEVKMSQDRIVVPKLGRGLRGSCEYGHHCVAETKALPQKFGGAQHISTTLADGELTDGGDNWDTRCIFLQNVDK